MSNGHDDLVLLNEAAIPVRIYSCEIADVVSVRLKPSNHGKLVGEEPGVAVRHADVETLLLEEQRMYVCRLPKGT
jgi:hypothetical protein